MFAQRKLAEKEGKREFECNKRERTAQRIEKEEHNVRSRKNKG